MASASLSGFSMTGWNAQSFRPQLPLPPIVYPPLFGKGFTVKYFLQSKLLALAFLILVIAFLVAFISAFLPFWFVLRFNVEDSTFGSEGSRMLSKDTGIYFFTGDDYVSLLFLEKITNRAVVPYWYKYSQVMEMMSVAAVFCACAGSGILAFRKYSSVTGILFLAILGTIAALGQILMVLSAVMSLISSANDVCEKDDSGCQYLENQVWRNLPFKEQFRRITEHTTPKMEANWGFYIACIGAALSVGGCVLLWLEGLKVCRSVGDIRYQQLRQKRDVYENERPPTDFIYSPPSLSSRAVPQPPMYGFEPSGGVSYVPPRQTYRPPPSVSGASTQSGSAYMSREVDL
ncbi:uncharacterized protein LOC143276940 [Babylonia areolata]|uniref:uncharacterized protein LOC143276940 n=1 Tax=Babylonia areolata TaxID=304850 RepID=UPI003FD4D259